MEEPQQGGPVNPVHPRRMMRAGPRPHFMGARHPFPAGYRPFGDLSGVPRVPIPFYPYPVAPTMGQPPDTQAVSGHPDDTESGNSTGENTGSSPASVLNNDARRFAGRRRQPIGDSLVAADPATTQQAMSAYCLLWSWLTQLHNTYDLNISLSMKTTSAKKINQENENPEENADDTIPIETDVAPQDDKV